MVERWGGVLLLLPLPLILGRPTLEVRESHTHSHTHICQEEEEENLRRATIYDHHENGRVAKFERAHLSPIEGTLLIAALFNRPARRVAWLSRLSPRPPVVCFFEPQSECGRAQLESGPRHESRA